MIDRRVIVITGASRGIGAEVARRAASAGYAVVVNYRQNANAAKEITSSIAAGDGLAFAVRGDVGDPEDVAQIFEAVDQHYGRLDALVNNAGLSGNRCRVERFDPQTLEQLFAVNVLGAINCCREAVRRMSTRNGGSGGAIVNVSSMAATIGGRAGSSDYAASKAAVDSFTVGLAKEVADEGIRVNAIRPGMIQTDMTDAFQQDPQRLADIEATIPMKRMGRPQEIADPVMWLLSDDASFISGACLDASGGGFLIGKPKSA